MWGADVPHSEGTSPYTIEAVRLMLHDLPDDAVDELLATRAAEVYGFDLEELQSIADRIGPTRGEIRTPLRADEVPRFPQDTRCTIFGHAMTSPVTTGT